MNKLVILFKNLFHYKTKYSFYSCFKLSRDLHALLINRNPGKHKVGTKFFQPGDPENEEIAYVSTTKQRTRRTRSTTQMISIETTTELPTMTVYYTTEATTITSTFIMTTTTTFFTTITTTTTTTTTATTTLTSSFVSPMTTTLLTPLETTMNINIQARSNGQRRRNNMTLYILTSGEHKIRRFSINHTRGFLINCNQLRRRLLNRRRYRDIPQTTTNISIIIKNSSTSSIQIVHRNILSLTMLSMFFLQK